ncbi:MAG: zinc-ribbon domain-containing protein [Chloroflexota bacterium]
MIIWGWRQYVQTVAMLTLVCGRCGNPSAHALRRFTTKFTLFFVPLFPVNRRHEVQCTFCGATNKVSRDQARAMQEQGDGQQAAQQPQQPGFPQPAFHQQPAQPPMPPVPPMPPGPQAPYGQPQPGQQPGWPGGPGH